MYQFQLKFLKNEKDHLKWIQKEAGESGRPWRSTLETRRVEGGSLEGATLLSTDVPA